LDLSILKYFEKIYKILNTFIKYLNIFQNTYSTKYFKYKYKILISI